MLGRAGDEVIGCVRRADDVAREQGGLVRHFHVDGIGERDGGFLPGVDRTAHNMRIHHLRWGQSEASGDGFKEVCLSVIERQAEFG